MNGLENHLGEIIITEKYLKSLISYSVTECIGVVGMQSFGFKQKVKAIVKLPSDGTGIAFKIDSDGGLIIKLHILASFGTNVATVVSSVEEKVKYALMSEAGVEAKRIDVYVDGMKA